MIHTWQANCYLFAFKILKHLNKSEKDTVGICLDVIGAGNLIKPQKDFWYVGTQKETLAEIEDSSKVDIFVIS